MNLHAEPDVAERAIRLGFQGWLAGVVRQPAVHARMVNTLSMLEHVGSVKIARTQAGPAISEQKLRHLAEETRHAQVLKRIVRALEADVAANYADARLLAGPAARGYFARRDAGVRQWVRAHLAGGDANHEAAYLLVTLLVETRAEWLYPVYQEALGDAGLRYSVRAIIGEEDRHLAEMHEGLAVVGLAEHPALAELFRLEQGLFARLANAMFHAAPIA